MFPFLSNEENINNNLDSTSSRGGARDSSHNTNNTNVFPAPRKKGRLPGYFPFGTPDRFDQHQAELYQHNLRTLEIDQVRHDNRLMVATNKSNKELKKAGWEWPSEAHARVLARRKANITRLGTGKERINEFSQSHMELSVGR